MRVVLIRPLLNESPNSPFFLPLGLLAIATHLQAFGHQAEIIDFEYLHRAGLCRFSSGESEAATLGRVLDYIGDLGDSLVAISCLSDSLPIAVKMAGKIKDNYSNVKIILGGPGVYTLASVLLSRWNKAIDFVCTGEGEIATRHVCEFLEGVRDISSVSGVSWVDDDHTIKLNPTEFVDFALEPSLDYSIIPLANYIELACPRIFDYYLGSGCSFSCSFCSTAGFWQRKFRARPPNRVLEDLDSLNRLIGITKFNLLHDNFANNRNYLTAFVDYFIQNNHLYEWGCAVRSDSLSLSDLRRMKDAGCFMIFCGSDSGSSKILQAMRKMPSASKTYQFYQNCKDAGIVAETNTIIGYPGEGPTELESSFEIVFDTIAYGGGSADASILQPLPGAQISEQYHQYLEYQGMTCDTSYYPSWIESFVKENFEVFPSYGFIRFENQSFSYYQHCLQFIRFYTRHFFCTLYALKNLAQFDYLSACLRSGKRWSLDDQYQSLASILEAVDIPQSMKAFLVDLLNYEYAVEQLKGSDLDVEMENVYSTRSATLNSRLWRVVCVDHSVHSFRTFLPAISRDLCSQSKHIYLIFRNAESSVVTAIITDSFLRKWSQIACGEVDLDVYRQQNSNCPVFKIWQEVNFPQQSLQVGDFLANDSYRE